VKTLIASVPLMLVALVVMVALRFSNPSLTETELFVALWPVWILVIVLTVATAANITRKG
jgi:hypothetical protein